MKKEIFPIRSKLNLSRKQLKEFKAIAANAGQDLSLLYEGESQNTYHRIATMQEARRILSQATKAQRRKRSETFLDGLEYRSRIPQGMHDRGEAYVFADHPLEEERDKGGHNNHLPIYVRTLSILEKVVPAGEVWDLSVHPSEWDVDEREEMYNIVNIGKLTLEANASIIVRGNAFILTCQKLVKEGSSPENYDIGILDTPHGFGYRMGDFDGADGRDGADGKKGADGRQPRLGTTFLGPVTDQLFKKESLDGKDGTPGEAGTNGESGLNGGACRLAEINLRHLTTQSPVTVGVIPGSGGNGGDGGNGGCGGDGGTGADGFRTVEKNVEPGHGGDGGPGGNGGKGGRAGHGGISSNVFLEVPEDEIDNIRYYSKKGLPGKPGKGGAGGKGGRPGRGGLPYKRSENEKQTDTGPLNGTPGKPGKDGRDGRTGRVMPAAKVYLNSRHETGSGPQE
ncbi:hypothetical protein [Fodinibius halophilus]|uniref:hypothetical protein n=1 Tax=Fodinibius halophilus TaxID=1736908 RepID=UPI0023F379E1|nr:hypothetical protein [Fodinibius halophilus]